MLVFEMHSVRVEATLLERVRGISMRRMRIAFLSLLLSLGGCAALQGAPSPIIPAKDSVKLAADYALDDAIKAFRADDDASRDDMTPQAYRDMVIAIYLAAIDARYLEFRRAVSSQGRGGALGADLAVLGLTTGATVINGAATELSAAAAAIAGGKAVVDKNVFFDKALPALLAAMDAERARMRTQIVLNMRKDANSYPLETAFGDISAYEAAASLDRAVDVITTSASQERRMERQRYDNAVRACDGEDDLVDRRARIMKFVSSLANAGNAVDLDKMAKLMGLAGGSDAAQLRIDIRRDLLANYCTNEKLEELLGTVARQAWGSSI